MSKVPLMDTTGEAILASIVKHFTKSGIVLISGLNAQPESVLKKTGLFDLIGLEHFFEHTGDAIQYGLSQINENKCLGCKHFAFRECKQLSAKEVVENRAKLTATF
jgi:SulP family sulfate permease